MFEPTFLKSVQKLPVSFPVFAEALPAEEDDPPDGALAEFCDCPPLAELLDDPPEAAHPASAAQDRTRAAAPGKTRRAGLRAGISCFRDLEVSAWGGPG
jgi:hypothetical protein